MKKLSSIIMIGLLVSISSVSFGQRDESTIIRSYVDGSPESEQDLQYYKQAAILKDLLAKQGLSVTLKVVVKMLKAIDANMPKYFPNGPFTRNDFIALAWLESAFHQHEIGTHGERGLFQIMPDEFEDWHVTENFFDIDVNTKMAFRVLNGKYKHWKDYKKAIQAYNGVIRLKNGMWSEKYYKQFEKRRIAVETVLAVETNLENN